MANCSEKFSCDGVNEIVHFKFNRFNIETEYDYIAIGLPTEYEGQSSRQLRNLQNNVENSLVLEGSPQTNIWVSAESIQDFRIYFHRIVQAEISISNAISSEIRTLFNNTMRNDKLKV